MAGRRGLYPPIEPYAAGMLDVGDGHRVYWEMCGTPGARPAVVLHGGPGAALSPNQRRLFDPSRYQVLLFDQRGCGRSTPNASLEANTTWHLVADIERLRELAGVDRWSVLGGSWGPRSPSPTPRHIRSGSRTSCSGAYSPAVARRSRWYYQDGASWLYPDLWEDFLAPIPLEERTDMVAAYRRRLIADEPRVRLEAARAWSLWEGQTITMLPDAALRDRFGEDGYALAFARIENHYFVHDAFLEPGQLISDVDRMRHIPAVMVQGRYDLATPMRTAWELHQAWPEAEFHIVPDAGHAYDEPGTLHHLIEATDRFADDRARDGSEADGVLDQDHRRSAGAVAAHDQQLVDG